MDQLEKLRAEEAELEAQMLGDQAGQEPVGEPTDPEASTTEDTGIQQTQEELDAAEFMAETIVAQPEDEPQVIDDPEPPPQKQTRTNWKKRFTNYKSSTDATIHGLRKDLMDMKQQMGNLMQENQRLATAKREEQGDLFEGAFTQEDEDTFGADGLDVVKKAAKVAIERQVKPLQEELQKQKQSQIDSYQRQAKNEKAQAYQQFLGKLETLVPDYVVLNKDKEFLQWLGEADAFSGQPRGELFRRAEASGDVFRVADFFTDFKSSKTAVEQTNATPESLKQHITPTGSGGGSTVTKQKTSDPGYYRQSDIDKFYNDMMKGRYADQPGVIQATEAAIEQAIRDNRVLRGQ